MMISVTMSKGKSKNGVKSKEIQRPAVETKTIENQLELSASAKCLILEKRSSCFSASRQKAQEEKNSRTLRAIGPDNLKSLRFP